MKAAVLLLGAWLALGSAQAEDGPESGSRNPGAQPLSGLLAQVRSSGSVALAYRTSSVPFSYLNAQGQPIGYSIALCQALVQGMEQVVQRPLTIRWVPVTAATRQEAITSGAADLECGSTTSNVARQRTVAFSPTIFVAGTRLLVRKKSGIRDWRDLAGKSVAVTEGTTNAALLQKLAPRLPQPPLLLVQREHQDAFAQVVSGAADAFATDDVLLHGLVAQTPGARERLAVVGELLSYEPYALMFRKGDAQLAKFVTDRLRSLAADGEIERQYERWFLRPLPDGQRLNLPMSAQLQAIIESLAAAQVE